MSNCIASVAHCKIQCVVTNCQLSSKEKIQTIELILKKKCLCFDKIKERVNNPWGTVTDLHLQHDFPFFLTDLTHSLNKNQTREPFLKTVQVSPKVAKSFT